MTNTRPAHTVRSTKVTSTPDQHPAPRDVRRTHENSSSLSGTTEVHGLQHTLLVALHTSSPHLSTFHSLSTVSPPAGEAIQHPNNSITTVTGSIVDFIRFRDFQSSCFLRKNACLFCQLNVYVPCRKTRLFVSMLHQENHKANYNGFLSVFTISTSIQQDT